MKKTAFNDEHGYEAIRYLVNGVIATAVHFGVLSFGIEVLAISPAGLANLLAACVGIAVSFLGSRYFVFKNHNDTLFRQAAQFVLLYACIACLHTLVLILWSDWLGFSYKTGFVIATALQVSMSYVGNKFMVFSK